MEYNNLKSLPYIAAQNAARYDQSLYMQQRISKYDKKISQLVEQQRKTYGELPPAVEANMRISQAINSHQSREQPQKSKVNPKLTQQQQCERLADKVIMMIETLVRISEQSKENTNKAIRALHDNKK